METYLKTPPPIEESTDPVDDLPGRRHRLVPQLFDMLRKRVSATRACGSRIGDLMVAFRAIDQCHVIFSWVSFSTVFLFHHSFSLTQVPVFLFYIVMVCANEKTAWRRSFRPKPDAEPRATRGGLSKLKHHLLINGYPFIRIRILRTGERWSNRSRAVLELASVQELRRIDLTPHFQHYSHNVETRRLPPQNESNT